MESQVKVIPEAIYCSIDPVVFSLIDNRLHILLIKRQEDPYKDRWALPGGLVIPSLDQSIQDSVVRVLKSKSGAEVNYVEQLESIGGYRDPRGFSISIAYMALVAKQDIHANARWVAVDELDAYDVAFDHPAIVAEAIRRLTNKVNYSTLPMHLLGDNFTLPQLQRVYEILLGEKLDKSTFRKKIEESGMLIETGEMLKDGAFRPAKLYEVAQQKIVHFTKNIVN